ncbi:MAG: SDR family oxidoreductase [Campylobacterales bacterium]|nr:SDR family oxidoreductase [Campylobacterales bacterium]
MSNPKKKAVVLGSQGMAGHIMAEVLDLTGEYEIFGVARQAGNYVDEVIDVTDANALKAYLERIKPDYVINCIGALVSQSQNDPSTAILLNSFLPNFLSKLGNTLGYKLIHISTDCVFSGKDGQYDENSFRDGDDNYARSKALGEVINEKDLTIRTSIIGPELKTNGAGLLDWFFKQEGPINGYTQAFWSGVTTLELAKATVEFIKQDITGLYQLCPAEKISKFELLKRFAKVWDKEIEIRPYEGYKVDKSLICTRDDFTHPRPEYEKMLLEMKEWMSEHSEYYSHYGL